MGGYAVGRRRVEWMQGITPPRALVQCARAAALLAPTGSFTGAIAPLSIGHRFR